MIKKICFVFLLLFLFDFFGCTSKTTHKYADANNDSIQKYLDLAGNDTLSFALRNKYNDRAFSLLDLSKNDTLTRYYLSKIGTFNYRLGNWRNLKLTTDELYIKSVEKKDSNDIAKSLRFYGVYYTLQSKNDTALYYMFKSKNIYKKLNNREGLSIVFANISQIQKYESDFLGSNLSAIEGLKLTTDIDKILYFHYNIAENLSLLDDKENSLKKYSFILDLINKKKGRNYSKSGVWSGIGLIYFDKKEYKKSIFYFKKIVDDKSICDENPSRYAYALDQLAYSYLKIKELKKLPKIFFDSEKIRDNFKIENGRNYNKIYLSDYYATIKDTLKSIIYAREAVNISKKFKNPLDIVNSLKQLIIVDKKNASRLSNEYIRITDSLQLAERKFREKYAQIAFETDEINQEKNKAIQQKWIITGIAVTILLVVILLFIISYQRTKQKELELQKAQQKYKEEIYELILSQKEKEEKVKQAEKKRIAQELHDGVMNKLASTRLNLSMLSQETDSATIQKCLTHVSEIYQIENEIRAISHDLNQETIITQDGYICLLQDFILDQNRPGVVKYDLELDKSIDWDNLTNEMKMSLYRIIQEATANINKHAKAKKGIITLIQDEQNLCLSILDDGIGFDPNTTTEGIGIKNIKHRVKALKGKFKLTSLINESTSVNISIPIK